MQTNGPNLELTLAAWADITLKIWKERIAELKVYDSGELLNSLLQTLVYNAGANEGKVEFSFKLYGIFVDMGVGREVFKGNDGDLGFTPIRKRKEWYSRVFYREVMRLREIIAEKFSEHIANTIIFALKPMKDLKYAHAKGKNYFVD